MKKLIILQTIENISSNSKIEKSLAKTTNSGKNQIEKIKLEKLKTSIFVALFFWLGAGVLLKNILAALGVSIIAGAIIFFILIKLPLIQNKKRAKKIEAQLPLFLMHLITEIKLGKSLATAIKDSCNEKNAVCEEFTLIYKDMQKGVSFSQALEKINQKLESPNLRRVFSHLSNIHGQGAKDVTGLKKLAEELLLKQRIESKEFSGKMTVYALVFIAVSAIVPAMFLSFTLIGSYFMNITFSGMQILGISVILFPAVDFAILLVIDSKTPLFLKQ